MFKKIFVVQKANLGKTETYDVELSQSLSILSQEFYILIED